MTGSQKKNKNEFEYNKNYSINDQQVDKRIAILTQVHSFPIIFFFYIHIPFSLRDISLLTFLNNIRNRKLVQ